METLVDKSVTILCHKNSHKENMPQKIWLIVYEAFYFDSLKCFRWTIRKLEMDQKWVLARDHLIPRLKIPCWDVLLIHFQFQWEPTFASNWMPYSLDKWIKNWFPSSTCQLQLATHFFHIFKWIRKMIPSYSIYSFQPHFLNQITLNFKNGHFYIRKCAFSESKTLFLSWILLK